MAKDRGSTRGRPGRPVRRGRDSQLPVVRWLQVGVVSAGFGVLLATSSAVAAAEDTGGSSSSVAGASAAQTGQASGSAADPSSDSAESSAESVTATSASSGDTGELPSAVVDLVDGDELADVADHSQADAQASKALPEVEADAELASEAAAIQVTAETGAGDFAGSATDGGVDAGTRVDGATGVSAALAPTQDGLGPDPAYAPAESGDPGDTSGSISVSALSVPGFEATAVEVADQHATVAVAAGEYPQAVLAPVTWRSVVVDMLSWTLGWSDPVVPIPDSLVPDWLAGLWLGVRKLRYTFVNVRPTVTIIPTREDPVTGVVFGTLEGHDPDGDVVTYRLTAPPDHGSVVIGDDGNWTYTPDPGLAGEQVTFSVTALDTSAANPWHMHGWRGIFGGVADVLSWLGGTNASAATVRLGGDSIAATPAVTHTIIVGPFPIDVASSPDGAKVYLTEAGLNTLSVIETATNTVINTIPVGTQPAGVAVNPDGSHVYVVNTGDNNVSVIAAATLATAATVAVGASPNVVAVSPDGSTLYVTNTDDKTVSVIDTATNTVVKTIAVGADPIGVAFNPQGTTAYVANPADDTVSVIDTATNTVTTTVEVAGAPFMVAVSPDGSRAYVTNQSANSVSVIDTATNTVSTAIEVGQTPAGVAFSADGALAFVVNQKDNTVSVIDTATSTVTRTVAVGSTPVGVAVTPGAANVYVADSGSDTVSVISNIGWPNLPQRVLGGLISTIGYGVQFVLDRTALWLASLSNPVTDWLSEKVWQARTTLWPVSSDIEFGGTAACIHTKQCRNMTFVNGDFMGRNMAGVDFTGSRFINSNVAMVNLRGANMTGVLVQGGGLLHSNLTDATLVNAIFAHGLRPVNNSSTNLTRANLTGARWSHTDWTGAKWDHTTCPDGSTSSQGCSSG
ncbi:MAG: beta-propeller fold lactonase family protein [Mycolicibacterium sp.]|uniref:YVTN family beta-propeller repeat protein n=1 Tax=Mycolicibacterium sp. TaxID=2320850 RepID=UPI003D0B38C4